MALLPIAVPLLAALAFPVGALALKRVAKSGRDVWGLVLICDFVAALVFLPLLFPLRGPPAGAAWWQPLGAGAVFCLGQIAAFKSFQGDLSIAIPIQGAKVLVVAVLAWLALGQSLGLKFWAAAALSVAAIRFLNEPGPAKDGPKRIMATSLWAGLAAIAFAAFDVAMQAWSPVWVALGAGTMAFIILGLALSIGGSGQAALVNLVFNTRCVVSVIFVSKLA